MTKNYVEYNGKKFPVRTVNLSSVSSYYTDVDVADYELFAAIESDYDEGKREAVEIDNSIFFYCDSGFIESDPTDEEIIDYLAKCGI